MSYVTNLYRQPMCHIRHSRRRRIIKVVFLLIMLLPSLGAFADKYDLSRMTINSWSSLSNDSLFKTADGFMATQPSKGLVCFSILANRYYTGPQSRHDMYLYAKAFYFLQSCFYARSYNDEWANEKFEVLYSSTDTDTASFKLLAHVENVPSAEWTRYAFQLPDDARYFVIRCVTHNGKVLQIDYNLSGFPITDNRL